MSHLSTSRTRRLVIGAALLILAAAGCATAAPTLDERIEDLDAAVDLYQTVEGAECATPSPDRGEDGAAVVDCEDGATIVWKSENIEDELQRGLTAAIMSDDHGIDAVVGVNVTIMNVDAALVAAQIGGEHV